jgi:hypothetical protein
VVTSLGDTTGGAAEALPTVKRTTGTAQAKRRAKMARLLMMRTAVTAMLVRL